MNETGIAEGYLSACEQENRELRVENERLREAFANSEVACLIQVQMVRAENERLRSILRQILEDNEARILNSYRDAGWEALGGQPNE